MVESFSIRSQLSLALSSGLRGHRNRIAAPGLRTAVRRCTFPRYPRSQLIQYTVQFCKRFIQLFPVFFPAIHVEGLLTKGERTALFIYTVKHVFFSLFE